MAGTSPGPNLLSYANGDLNERHASTSESTYCFSFEATVECHLKG